MTTGAGDDTARAAREQFERAVDAMPAATANRLRLARRVALAGTPARRHRVAWALPLGAAAAVFLGLAWWRQAPGPPLAVTAPVRSVPSPAVPPDDDADLYAWIADTPVASDAKGGRP